MGEAHLSERKSAHEIRKILKRTFYFYFFLRTEHTILCYMVLIRVLSTRLDIIYFGIGSSPVLWSIWIEGEGGGVE